LKVRKGLVLVVLALLLVAASVTVTLYVTSDSNSRNGITRTDCPITSCDAEKEARFVCDQTSAAAVEVDPGLPGVRLSRFEC
jgi:hypothetical protein